MTALFRACLLLLPLSLLAGCGDNAVRYLLDPPVTEKRYAVRVSTIELREVSLPAYAAATEINLQDTDGALRPAKQAIWADDPVRGVTQALVRDLDLITTAAAAAEPWPLDEPADVRIDVRIDRMIAGSDGQFRLGGQYAVAAPGNAVRESLNRFDLARPIAGETPKAVADATAAVLLDLAEHIALRLQR